MNVDLTEEDIIVIQYNIENDINTKHSNTHNPDDQMKDTTEGHKHIVFTTFDLSTKIIEFGNESSRVTTVANGIKYHPTKSTLLKSLLIKSLFLNPIPASDSIIHFTPTGLI